MSMKERKIKYEKVGCSDFVTTQQETQKPDISGLEAIEPARNGNKLETKAILPGLNPAWIRQNYARFWFQFLGYNLQSLKDGRILTKGQFLEHHDPEEPFTIIPFEPGEGWQSEAEREEHFRVVAELRRLHNVTDLITGGHEKV